MERRKEAKEMTREKCTYVLYILINGETLERCNKIKKRTKNKVRGDAMPIKIPQ